MSEQAIVTAEEPVKRSAIDRLSDPGGLQNVARAKGESAAIKPEGPNSPPDPEAGATPEVEPKKSAEAVETEADDDGDEGVLLDREHYEALERRAGMRELLDELGKAEEDGDDDEDVATTEPATAPKQPDYLQNLIAMATGQPVQAQQQQQTQQPAFSGQNLLEPVALSAEAFDEVHQDHAKWNAYRQQEHARSVLASAAFVEQVVAPQLFRRFQQYVEMRDICGQALKGFEDVANKHPKEFARIVKESTKLKAVDPYQRAMWVRRALEEKFEKAQSIASAVERKRRLIDLRSRPTKPGGGNGSARTRPVEEKEPSPEDAFLEGLKKRKQARPTINKDL